MPHDTIQIVAASPSEKCNNYSYTDNVLSPVVTKAQVYGPVEVDLNTPYASSNRMEVKMGQGSTKPEVKISDKNGNPILDVQGFTEKNIGGIVVYSNWRQIHMNADKLTLNGTQLALKEVTFGDATLSVLAAV